MFNFKTYSEMLLSFHTDTIFNAFPTNLEN